MIELRWRLLNVELHRPDLTNWDGLLPHLISPACVSAVWHKYTINKCYFSNGLAFKNHLLTRDMMILFGLNIQPTCLLYNQDNEEAEHLSSNGIFAAPIFSAMPSPSFAKLDRLSP